MEAIKIVELRKEEHEMRAGGGEEGKRRRLLGSGRDFTNAIEGKKRMRDGSNAKRTGIPSWQKEGGET